VIDCLCSLSSGVREPFVKQWRGSFEHGERDWWHDRLDQRRENNLGDPPQ